MEVTNRIAALKVGRGVWRHERTHERFLQAVHEAKTAAVGLEQRYAAQDERAAAWLFALAMQAPQAAHAQEQMDTHPHGYHNREKRLYELIDFNDAFVSTILALPEDELTHFPENAKRLLDIICKKVGARCFTNEQWGVIVHGLSREIAVFRGVKQEGYHAEMTNRTSDAFGIDMRITDPGTMSSVNVDIKTRSSYHYRIQDLYREGRLSEEELLMAERRGFVRVYNERGEARVPVVIWEIDHDLLGDIRDFSFTKTQALGMMMRRIMTSYGEKNL